MTKPPAQPRPTRTGGRYIKDPATGALTPAPALPEVTGPKTAGGSKAKGAGRAPASVPDPGTPETDTKSED